VNGDNPVAVVFARDLNPTLTGLVKKIDEATAKNSGCDMGSFVVLLTDDKEKVEADLKKLAEREGLKKVALTIESATGPRSYNIAQDADVTVLLYVDRKVKKNFAFKKGELTDAKVEEIVKEIPAILPGK
jgi:hypothetical protein